MLVVVAVAVLWFRGVVALDSTFDVTLMLAVVGIAVFLSFSDAHGFTPSYFVSLGLSDLTDPASEAAQSVEHFFGRALKKKNWDREFQDIVDIVPRSGAEALSAELRLRKARSIVAHPPPRCVLCCKAVVGVVVGTDGG